MLTYAKVRLVGEVCVFDVNELVMEELRIFGEKDLSDEEAKLEFAHSELYPQHKVGSE